MVNIFSQVSQKTRPRPRKSYSRSFGSGIVIAACIRCKVEEGLFP